MGSGRRLLAALLTGLAARVGLGETTPMDTDVPEEKSTSIACEVTPAELKANPKLQGGQYHYKVWLPAGYKAAEKREYPVLFVASAGGEADPNMYAEQLKREQWIGIGLTESSNESGGRNLPNFIAAHDDAIKRFRIANHFKFMTGFSGGARTVGFCAAHRTGVAGLFLQAAGFGRDMEALKVNPAMCVYAVFGVRDSNRSEAMGWKSGFPPISPTRWVMAEGGHGWAAPETVDDAFNFMLECTYVKHPQPSKEAPVQYAVRFRMVLERARAAEGWDKFLAYEEANKIAIARKLSSDKTLAADVSEAATKGKELAKDPAIVKEIEARAAYRKVRDVEDEKWLPLAAGGPATELTKFMKQAATAYEGIGKKYAETAFGKKAAARAVWMALGGDKTE